MTLKLSQELLAKVIQVVRMKKKSLAVILFFLLTITGQLKMSSCTVFLNLDTGKGIVLLPKSDFESAEKRCLLLQYGKLLEVKNKNELEEIVGEVKWMIPDESTFWIGIKMNETKTKLTRHFDPNDLDTFSVTNGTLCASLNVDDKENHQITFNECHHEKIAICVPGNDAWKLIVIISLVLLAVLYLIIPLFVTFHFCKIRRYRISYFQNQNEEQLPRQDTILQETKF